MDAMILAAGVGSRLGEVTAHTPKALVPVGGVPVLERVARRLLEAGADRLIINVHHHAEQIVDYVRERGGFGVDVVFSHEPEAPLETGGGLLHAASLFRRNAPFFLHNVDVLSEVDLVDMYRAHAACDALATLAVNHRATSRYLLFDQHGLCGREDRRRPAAAAATAEPAAASMPDEGAGIAAIQPDGLQRYAFLGIHVISPTLLDRIEEQGAFSIIELYLRLARAGGRIAPYDAGNALWLEIGSPARLEAARQHFGG